MTLTKKSDSSWANCQPYLGVRLPTTPPNPPPPPSRFALVRRLLCLDRPLYNPALLAQGRGLPAPGYGGHDDPVLGVRLPTTPPSPPPPPSRCPLVRRLLCLDRPLYKPALLAQGRGLPAPGYGGHDEPVLGVRLPMTPPRPRCCPLVTVKAMMKKINPTLYMSELNFHKQSTLCVIHSVVIFCRACLICSTGCWADTAPTVQPNW